MNTPDVRVGDQDRTQAVQALAAHLGAGRLTLDEYDTRTAAAWAARTRGDLDRLFSDLPALRSAGGGHMRTAGPGRVLAAIVAVAVGLLVLLGLAAPGFAAGMMAMCM